MADITVSLTDEEQTALENASKSGRVRFMMRMMGIRGEIGDVSTPETFTTSLLKGLANDQIRKEAVLKAKADLKPKEIK